MFKELYQWSLYDLLGYEGAQMNAYMLEPLALLLTYIFTIGFIMLVFISAKWAVQYVTSFIRL